MSLVFASITPHPPIIIPQIGKENTKRLQQTILAYKKLEKILFSSNAQTIIIISPHGPSQKNAFTMNLMPYFKADFKEFGNFSTVNSWKGDIALAYKIREQLESKAPLQLISNENLDYGISIPLILLTQKYKNIKIIPIYYSGLGNFAHFQFGKLLKKEILKSNEKIGIIASGDLSHRLNKNSPGGYWAKAKKFDKKINKYLMENKIKDILELDKNFIAEAGECGLKSFLILLGILDKIKYKTKLLSYESPFGVGYLTMNFEL